MAANTEPPEPAIMHIVIPVAAPACPALPDSLLHRLFVAGMTIQVPVRAIKREIRAVVVIKLPQRPGVRVVALLALRTQLFLVRIIVGMTVITFR